jgi:hypothetical protein
MIGAAPPPSANPKTIAPEFFIAREIPSILIHFHFVQTVQTRRFR